MKVTLVVCAVVAVALAVPSPDGEHYDSKYDDFDVDTLIENLRLLKSYANCFLGKGSCTAEGASFKKVMPEAVATTCAKCTPKQRILVRKVIKAIQANLSEEWEELKKEYDPEGKYHDALEKFLQASD
ncbi:Putative odorant-binding protein A10 [Eumeta japonica]|uniref:Odorant-binding protein A10 n=1 Tax=Eumeta variegata TaxID=151549 RepID=A0A4C1T3I4_EUMVA|nr:Putative odorant-binding protein A10 [Eumeta japonica]